MVTDRPARAFHPARFASRVVAVDHSLMSMERTHDAIQTPPPRKPDARLGFFADRKPSWAAHPAFLLPVAPQSPTLL